MQYNSNPDLTDITWLSNVKLPISNIEEQGRLNNNLRKITFAPALIPSFVAKSLTRDELNFSKQSVISPNTNKRKQNAETLNAKDKFDKESETRYSKIVKLSKLLYNTSR